MSYKSVAVIELHNGQDPQATEIQGGYKEEESELGFERWVGFDQTGK